MVSSRGLTVAVICKVRTTSPPYGKVRMMEKKRFLLVLILMLGFIPGLFGQQTHRSPGIFSFASADMAITAISWAAAFALLVFARGNATPLNRRGVNLVTLLFV